MDTTPEAGQGQTTTRAIHATTVYVLRSLGIMPEDIPLDILGRLMDDTMTCADLAYLGILTGVPPSRLVTPLPDAERLVASAGVLVG